MGRSTIFVIVAWVVLLAITIVLLAIGIKPEELASEFLGLLSPVIYLLVRKRQGLRPSRQKERR